MLRLTLFACVATGLAAAVAAAPPLDPRAARPELRLLLPMYVFPNPDPASAEYKAWQELIDARGAPVVVVLNPNSGPVVDRNPAVPAQKINRECYDKVLARAKANPDLSFVGYVTLSDNKSEPRNGQPEWITRDPKAIARDVDLWYSIYGKDNPRFRGIFFDLQPAFDPEQLSAANKAVEHVYRTHPTALVVRNAGRVPDSPDVLKPAADDVVCLWEKDAKADPFEAFALPAWAGKKAADSRPVYGPDRFLALIYHQPEAEVKYVRAVRDKGVGWLCVTDGSGDWNRLPSYWKDLVKAVAAVNAEGPPKAGK
ncbi:spherulation-specific family 4 protein [Fimbriiglobus ruber]|uniref:Spherulation-specific family 4 n=1 Tax=Fimbriiglobus ruber TaxID=1908690 RepID=A0A225DZL7_9BACT|nr:spherulation-specific family 4 protein [Fimbriiglobus ruber]OWK45024.1 hypothetical protein FRUB_01355 [Fimbriiglobus ruber]